MQCNPQDVQRIQDALTKNPQNFGVGVLHEPSGEIALVPFDDCPGGHAELALRENWPLSECKGFSLCRQPGGSIAPINNSHLNGTQGNPSSLQMPQAVFEEITKALGDAGL